MKTPSVIRPSNQQGAALIVGLVLLVVVTVLAISGINTATTELAMARNDQNYENAFQAAETGLEQAFAQLQYNTAASTAMPKQDINESDSVSAIIQYEGTTLVPDRAFSIGAGSGVSAYHFVVTAQSQSKRSAGITDRDTSAIHTQGFYIVGPQAPTL